MKTLLKARKKMRGTNESEIRDWNKNNRVTVLLFAVVLLPRFGLQLRVKVPAEITELPALCRREYRHDL
jgi:hypothetical protein